MKLFHTPLFLGITESEFETMKELHSMRSSFFFKNGTIFHTGDLSTKSEPLNPVA